MGPKKVILTSVLFIFIASIFIFKFPGPVFAVTITVDDYPQTITQDPFGVTVSVSGASPATNYLRVDLYKENTTNYFGETFNGSDWYGASNYTQYFPITIDSTKNWTGEVQARIGNPSQTEYDWEGSYRMRIRRYTSSGGSDATEANNSSVAIAINIPKPSPSPTPTPSASPSSSPTSAKSPSPSPKSTPSPQKSQSPKASPQVLAKSYSASAASSFQSPASSPSPATVSKNSPSSIKIASIFIGSGLILITLAGSFLWYKKKRGTEITDDEQKLPHEPSGNTN